MQRIYEPAAYQTAVGSYWETTTEVNHWPKLTRQITATTVIIGGGYTGLNCALELAENSKGNGDGVIVLEAKQPGWGASGRNGGFCCAGGTKMPVSAQIRKFGETAARNYFNAQIAAIATVKANLTKYAILADTHSLGETEMAHRPDQVEALEKERAFTQQFFGLDCTLALGEDLTKQGFSSPEFFGALTNPNGFALNPMKYILGLANAISQTGVKCFGNSPAIKIEQNSNGYKIETPQGTINAQKLVLATNGYSSENIPSWLKGRLLPILTNILVSEPLSTQELADQGWTSHQMCYDTRNALHYFRLMPAVAGENGPRMLFGMRGGTSASPIISQKMKLRVRRDFDRIFPAWREVKTPYFWSGLACLSRNLTCYVGRIPEMENGFTSLAYHGNGVAMGSHSGRLTGKLVAGEIEQNDIPQVMRQPLDRFPFPALRRTYLGAAYKWYEWRDG